MNQIKQNSTRTADANRKPMQGRGLYMDFMGPKRLVQAPIVTTTRHIKKVTATSGNHRAIMRDVSIERVSREIVREKMPNLVAMKPGITAKAPIATRTASKTKVAKPAAMAKNEVPDANNYSLGGKSPFITDAKIEKRPLGKSIPDGSAYEIRSSKNIYSQRSFIDKEVSNINKNPVIISMERKRSGWLWTLLTLLVIAVGAGIGVLLYLYFAA